MPAKSYMDRYVNPPEYLEEQRQKLESGAGRGEAFPAAARSATCSASSCTTRRWRTGSATSSGIIREESYYFLPQRQTKVMNEGWASYWHSKIMTTKVLTDAEVIDYADHHSGTVATQPGAAEPVQAGPGAVPRHRAPLEHAASSVPSGTPARDMAERSRWDRELGLGREKIFEVRKIHCDATFLDEFLTPEFCDEQQLFVSKQDRKTQKSGRLLARVQRDQAGAAVPVHQRRPAGDRAGRRQLRQPRRAAAEPPSRGRGPALGLGRGGPGERVRSLWRRPVRLETLRDGKRVRLGHDGDNATEELLQQKPAAKSS